MLRKKEEIMSMEDEHGISSKNTKKKPYRGNRTSTNKKTAAKREERKK